MGADERVGAALGEDQLPVLGDLLAEAHAAIAEDAALAVDRDQRRERERLDEVALGLDHAAAAQAPAERDVLQRALAALVADRAVERVVDEQELDDRVLRVAATRSIWVLTTMPSRTAVEHEVWSFGIPSISTRHMRQAPTGSPSFGS